MSLGSDAFSDHSNPILKTTALPLGFIYCVIKRLKYLIDVSVNSTARLANRRGIPIWLTYDIPNGYYTLSPYRDATNFLSGSHILLLRHFSFLPSPYRFSGKAIARYI